MIVGLVSMDSLGTAKLRECSLTAVSRTARWLEVRPWISRHYHIKLPDRLHVRRSHRRLSEHFSRLREENIKVSLVIVIFILIC